MRDEGMTMPPDLLLIFKALVTIDGVLQAIEPDFDLSAAMERATLRIVKARLSSEHWAPVVQALAWEVIKLGDDAPRLVRAAVRRLEADPAGPVQSDPAAAILTVGRWIAAAVLIAAGIIAAAQFLA